MREVTDPNLLAELNGTPAPIEVTDPGILAQLNADQPPEVAPAANEVDEEQGFFGNVYDRLYDRGAELQDNIHATQSGEQTGLESAIQAVGKNVVGAAFDVAGEGVASAAQTAWDLTPDMITKPIEDEATSFMQHPAAKAGMEALSKGAEAYGIWADDNPRFARNLESVTNIGMAYIPVKMKVNGKVKSLGAEAKAATGKPGGTGAVVTAALTPIRNKVVSALAKRGAVQSGEVLPEALPPAMQKVYSRLRADFPNDDSFVSAFDNYLSSDKALVEVAGERTKGLAEGAAMYQSGGAEALDFFKHEIDLTPQRLKDATAKNISPNIEFYKAVDDVFDQGRADAKPLYKQAFSSNQVIDSPIIDNILATPAGKSALKEASTEMQNQLALSAKPDPELSAMYDDIMGVGGRGGQTDYFSQAAREAVTGDAKKKVVILSPDEFLALTPNVDFIEGGKIDNITKLLDGGGKLDSMPELKLDFDSGKMKVDMHDGRHRALVLKEKGVDAMPVVIEGDSAKALGKIVEDKNLLEIGTQRMSYQDGGGYTLNKKVLDEAPAGSVSSSIAKGLKLETLDKVKRAMDTKINQSYRQGDFGEYGRLKDLKKGLVAELDALDTTDAYKKAREVSGDYLSNVEAMEDGLKFFTTDAELIGKNFKNMAQADKTAYRMGVVKAVRNRIDNVNDGANVAAMFRKPATRDRLKAILPAKAYKQLAEEAGAIDGLFKLRNQITGGSRTKMRDIASDEFDNAAEKVAEGIRKAKSPTVAAMDAAYSIVKRQFSGMSDNSAGDVAELLFMKDPKEKYLVAQKLLNEAKKEGGDFMKSPAGMKLEAYFSLEKLPNLINDRINSVATKEVGGATAAQQGASRGLSGANEVRPPMPGNDQSGSLIGEALDFINPVGSANASTLPPNLITDEGKRLNAYKDTLGYTTVGIGFNMDSGIAKQVWDTAGVEAKFKDVYTGAATITEQEARNLAQASHAIATSDARKFLPQFNRLSPSRQEALTNLSYQMGYKTLSKFKKFKAAMVNQDYRLAAQELVLSDWYKQTQPTRTRRILDQIVKGE